MRRRRGLDPAPALNLRVGADHRRGARGRPATPWSSAACRACLLDERMDIYEQRADMISIIASHHAEAFPEGDVRRAAPDGGIARVLRAVHGDGVRPEFEIWHSGSIWNLEYLLAHAELVRPGHQHAVLRLAGRDMEPADDRGVPVPAAADAARLRGHRERDGPGALGMLAAAITSGDHVRVGTEDYGFDRWGKPAQASDLVTELVGLAEALGRPVATPEEARKCWRSARPADDGAQQAAPRPRTGPG